MNKRYPFVVKYEGIFVAFYVTAAAIVIFLFI